MTPSVWDLHLHHVVWLAPDGGPTFASGEEKTIAKMPQGYGFKVGGDANWGLNYMIHSLSSSEGRQVYITWEIDWVPETQPVRVADHPTTRIHWLDVAGAPQLYPVFDAERGFDTNGDGKYTFPDEVPTDPAAPGYEEREKISNARTWTRAERRRDARLRRRPPAPGRLARRPPGRARRPRRRARSTATTRPRSGRCSAPTPTTTSPRARSAGTSRWTATRPDWRISLKAGDTVSINVTYDVSKASWYESMGILPLA